MDQDIIKDEGICRFCRKTFSGRGMTRHLKSCKVKKRKDAEACDGRETALIYHIKICAFKPYWLHIEAAAGLLLEDLDRFLRDVWVECCGHLSIFRIGAHYFESYVPGDMPAFYQTETMNFRLDDVLAGKDSFEYEYDFGTTTHLEGKVSGVRNGVLNEGIRVLARNSPPLFGCSECGSTAVWICGICQGFYCTKCLSAHECGEDMALPVVNSPRMGMCGYTGIYDKDGEYGTDTEDGPETERMETVKYGASPREEGSPADIEEEDYHQAVIGFLDGKEDPFTLNDVFEGTGLSRTKYVERDVREYLDAFYVREGPAYIPRVCYLAEIPLRIQPTEMEVENGILIVGHRILPFFPAGRNTDDIHIYDRDREIPTRRALFPMKHVRIFFSLMNLFNYPMEFDPRYDDEVDIKVWDMSGWYEAQDFTVGDSIILTSRDFLQGSFDIRCKSGKEINTGAFTRKKNDSLLLDGLRSVLEGKVDAYDTERQLMHAYYAYSCSEKADHSTACSSFGPMISEPDTDITFTTLPDGRTLLHPRGAQPDPEKSYFDMEEAIMQSEEDLFDEEGIRQARTMDELLPFLGSAVPACLVTAVIRDQIAEKGEADLEEIMQLIFACPEIIPPFADKRTRTLLAKEISRISKEKNDAQLILPVRTARSKIIELYRRIINYLRELERRRVDILELDPADMSQVHVIQNALESFLILLNREPSADTGTSILSALDDAGPELDRILKASLKTFS